MKTLYSLIIFCIFAVLADNLKNLDRSICGVCVRQDCPRVIPCTGAIGFDDCCCCVICLDVPGEVSENSSSGDGGDEDVPDEEQPAAILQQRRPEFTTLQPTNSDKYMHSTQIDQNKGIGNKYNVKREVILDALHDSIVEQTESTPPILEDKIRNTVRHTLLVPLQKGTQVVMDLGTMVVNFFLTEKASVSAGINETAESRINNGHLTTTAAHSLPKKEATASVNREKRETVTGMKSITQVLHQIMIDGNTILQMLTESGPQQVIRCAVNQVPIPGSHVLADIAGVVMEGIHESATYALQTSSVENPTLHTIVQSITGAIDQGFAEVLTYIPKIEDAVIEFLFFNPILTENTNDPLQVIQHTLRNINEYLDSTNKLLEEVTNAERRQRVKSQIRELLLPGSNVFAEVVDAIMAVTNAISKSVLESSFIKEKSSIPNLFNLVRNGIFRGITESCAVAPKVIWVTIETIEGRNIVYDDIVNNIEEFYIPKATKIRPVLNAYLQFACDNFRYKKCTLRQQEAHSESVTTPFLVFFVEVDAYVKRIFSDVGNIICTSKVLDETDSWDSLIEASNLINNTRFERLVSFQSKYNSKFADLNKLLNYLGCDGTTQVHEHFKILRNESIMEIIQSTFRRVSYQLQTETNEIIVRNQFFGTRLTKLPGGEILNIVTNIALQVVNEMSRQVSKSDFITKPPTWFNFWFSVIEAVAVGVNKAEDVFFEVVNSRKELTSTETLRMYRSLRMKRGSPSEIIPQVINERNHPQVTPVPISSERTPYTSPATTALPATSTTKSDVRDMTGIAVTVALKPCPHGKCDEYSVAVRHFTPGLLSNHFLVTFHEFIIQICKGVQDITGFLSSLVVPPFIRSSGIPFANEIAEIAGEVITLSSEISSKALQTPFLQNSPTWEAAEEFIVYSIRNAATGAIRLTIRFLSFVSDKLSEENGPISTMFQCKMADKEHKKTDPNVVISFRYEAASNKTNATDSPLVQDLSSALSDVHDVLSVAAVKNKGNKGTARTRVPKERKFLILQFIRGILRFEKLTGKLIPILIPQSCLVPAQQFLKEIAIGIGTLTGKLAQSGVTFQVKSSRLPFANIIADFVGKFFKTTNQLSSDAANSKYLNDPNPTWSMANKAVTSAVKSGLQVSMDVIVKAMKVMVKALSNFPDISIEESDVLKRSERNANVNSRAPTHNRAFALSFLAQKRVKRGYLKRMRERDHSTL